MVFLYCNTTVLLSFQFAHFIMKRQLLKINILVLVFLRGWIFYALVFYVCIFFTCLYFCRARIL